jgi:hypothetical protein
VMMCTPSECSNPLAGRRRLSLHQNLGVAETEVAVVL